MSTSAKSSTVNPSRRKFIKSAAMIGSFPFLPGSSLAEEMIGSRSAPIALDDPSGSIIGQYGPWAASLRGSGPPQLSYRLDKWPDLDSWRKVAQDKSRELLASPDVGGPPKVTVRKKYKYDGLDVEELSWQLSFGRSTEAVLLKPQNAQGPLPAVVGLHDHGGNKYLGKRKITQTSDQMPEFIKSHQEDSYEGVAWANELAKRGYAERQ